MKRLAVALLALALLATPLAVEAQPAGTRPRIGFLATAPSDSDLDETRQALRELGWVDGQNISIEVRWTEGRIERIRQLVAELVGLKVNVIYAEGSVAAARAAKEATTTIPIVVTSPADLVQTGLVASLARPGTNVTGVGGDIRQTKRLQLLKEAVPSATHIAVLWNPTNPAHEPALKETEGAALALGVRLQPVKASRPEEIAGAFSAMARERAEALFVIGDAMLSQELPQIVALAAQGRLPAMYILRRAVELGGLMAYREDRSSDPRLAAVYIDRILKGAKAAELPVELPTRFKFSINLKTARALGLTIPPSVLARADEVIQ